MFALTRRFISYPKSSKRSSTQACPTKVFGEQVCRERRRYEPQPLRTVFFGNEYSEKEIGDAVCRSGLEMSHHPTGMEIEVTRNAEHC